jgi:hypothetical protein
MCNFDPSTNMHPFTTCSEVVAGLPLEIWTVLIASALPTHTRTKLAMSCRALFARLIPTRPSVETTAKAVFADMLRGCEFSLLRSIPWQRDHNVRCLLRTIVRRWNVDIDFATVLWMTSPTTRMVCHKILRRFGFALENVSGPNQYTLTPAPTGHDWPAAAYDRHIEQTHLVVRWTAQTTSPGEAYGRYGQYIRWATGGCGVRKFACVVLSDGQRVCAHHRLYSEMRSRFGL